MGIFDKIINSLASEAKMEVRKNVNNAVDKGVKKAVSAIGKGKNSSQTFTFSTIPQNVDELKALPEASLNSAFKTTALAMLALLRYETSAEDSIAMLNFLSGPDPLSQREIDFIKERMANAPYIARSFFEGSTPANNYAATVPYKIKIKENKYSFDEENYATMWVTSSGADSERSVKLRKKPSSGQWFIIDLQCLAGIRKQVSDDKWA